MKWLSVIALAMLHSFAIAQHDIKASFPGGNNAYNQFLNENLVFPSEAIQAEASREIQAVIRIDTLGKPTVEQFMFPNSGLGFEREVHRFVEKMPNWKPAIHDGKVASSQVILTFTFDYVDPNAEVDEWRYEYYLESEELPVCPYGTDSLQRFMKWFLADSLQLRFDTAAAVLNIIVGADGKVIDGSVLSSNGAVADGYWVHACRFLPKWIPGRIKGQAVNVQRQLALEVVSD